MLLESKRLLVTGVLTPQSIAFEVARIAQEEGAEIVLSGFGKALALTQRSARRLPRPPEVLEMDVNDDDQIAAVAAHVRDSWGSLDGFLHAIAYAPEDALGGAFLETPRASAEIAFRTSAYSLKALTVGMLPLLADRGGCVADV
jgi:meromycolic acid enoyl-[acyl-carrier-protein] reductase